jgi:hypothetical protein
LPPKLQVSNHQPHRAKIKLLYYSTREKKSFHPLTPAPAWFLSLSSLQPDPRVAISLSPSLPALPKPLAFLRRRGAPIRSPEGAPPRFASCLDAVVVGDPAPITALRRGGRAWRHGDGAAGLMRRPRCRTPRRISAAPGRAPWSATSSRCLPRPAPPPFALHYIHAAFTFRFLVFVYWVGCGVQRIGARGKLTGTNLQVTGTGTCFACSPRELSSRRAAQLGRRGGSGRVSPGSVGNRCCFFPSSFHSPGFRCRLVSSVLGHGFQGLVHCVYRGLGLGSGPLLHSSALVKR